MKRFIAVLMVVLLASVAKPASASTWKLRFEAKGRAHLAMKSDTKGDYLLPTCQGMTGDHYAGPIEMRFDGLVIERYDGPPYYFKVYFGLGMELHPLNDPRLPASQRKARPIVMDEDFFAREHNIEFYFLGQDARGRNKKEQGDAPAIQFMLTPLTEPQDEPKVSKAQLEAATREAWEKGRDEAEKAGETQRQQMLRQLNELERRLAERQKDQLKANPPAPEFSGVAIRRKAVPSNASPTAIEQQLLALPTETDWSEPITIPPGCRLAMLFTSDQPFVVRRLRNGALIKSWSSHVNRGIYELLLDLGQGLGSDTIVVELTKPRKGGPTL